MHSFAQHISKDFFDPGIIMEQTIRKVLKASFLHSLLASDQDFSSLNFGYDVSYYSTSSSAIFVLSKKKSMQEVLYI